MLKICYNTSWSAGVAHPVERHLAKVEVASSSLVTRSIKIKTIHLDGLYFCLSYGWRENARGTEGFGQNRVTNRITL